MLQFKYMGKPLKGSIEGDLVFAAVEKLALGGEGLARSGGKRLFIPFTAPGDRIAARIIEDRPGWARAELVEILDPSPDRVTPCCPHYGTCGGCDLQHLSYDAQLRAKKDILLDALVHTGGLPGNIETPECMAVSSKPWEYRNRVSLHAIRANRGPRSGFKAAKSDTVIPLSDCPVSDPAVRGILPVLLPPPGKDRFTVYGWKETLLAEEGTSIASGSSLPQRGTITLLDKQIHLDARGFFQSNAAALESLIRTLRPLAEQAVRQRESTTYRVCTEPSREPRMADLYAGTGTFSVFLGDLFPGGIDLLEANPLTLDMAKHNVTAGRTRFFPQRDEQWITKHNLAAYDFVVADPPRQGLSPALSRSFCRSGPGTLAYISCEASSFARDCRILTEKYRLERLMLFDFYPQTAHIECMGLFIRK